MVITIRNIDIAAPIHRDTIGHIEPRRTARAVGAANGTSASDQGRHGHGLHHGGTDCRVGVAVGLPDAVDLGIKRHIERAPVGGQVGHSLRQRRALGLGKEVRAARCASNIQLVFAPAYSRVPREGRRAGGQRAKRHHLRFERAGSAEGDLADGAVAHIRNIEGAASTPTHHSHSLREAKPRRTARAVGAAWLCGGVPGQGRHHPCGRDLAEGIVARIRNIDVAAPIHRDTSGKLKPRGAARAVGAAHITGASGQGRHHPGRRDLADGAVA